MGGGDTVVGGTGHGDTVVGGTEHGGTVVGGRRCRIPFISPAVYLPTYR